MKAIAKIARTRKLTRSTTLRVDAINAQREFLANCPKGGNLR